MAIISSFDELSIHIFSLIPIRRYSVIGRYILVCIAIPCLILKDPLLIFNTTFTPQVLDFEAIFTSMYHHCWNVLIPRMSAQFSCQWVLVYISSNFLHNSFLFAYIWSSTLVSRPHLFVWMLLFQKTNYKCFWVFTLIYPLRGLLVWSLSSLERYGTKLSALGSDLIFVKWQFTQILHSSIIESTSILCTIFTPDLFLFRVTSHIHVMKQLQQEFQIDSV